MKSKCYLKEYLSISIFDVCFWGFFFRNLLKKYGVFYIWLKNMRCDVKKMIRKKHEGRKEYLMELILFFFFYFFVFHAIVIEDLNIILTPRPFLYIFFISTFSLKKQ